MKIGSVIEVKIHGKYNMCIILSNTTYHDVCDTWERSCRFLREYYVHPHMGLFISKSKYCHGDIDYNDRDSPLIHELLYGDKKIWAGVDMVEKYSREI